MSPQLVGVTAPDGGSSSVHFDWIADPAIGVTRYDLEIGTAPGLKDVAVVDVGLAVSWTQTLTRGTYWFRVRSWKGTTAGNVTGDYLVVASNRLGLLKAGLTVRLTGIGAQAGAGRVLVGMAGQSATVALAGVAAAGTVGVVGGRASTPVQGTGAVGTVTASVTTGTTGPHLTIDEWPGTVAVGARGRVLFQIIHGTAVTLLQVRLGTQVIAEVTATDMRDAAGLYFAVPRTPGAYTLTVRAVDRVGRETIAPGQSVTITP